jgi:hypothetical protein
MVEAGFDTGSGEDVPDWDNTERERDEDAAWHDLVARFDAPLTAQEPAPWPEREDMPRPAPRSEAAHEAGGPSGTYGTDGGNEANGERAGGATGGDRGSRRADGWRPADRRRATDGRRGGLEGLEADGAQGAFEADGAQGPLGAGTAQGPLGADGVQGTFGAAGMAEAQGPDVIETPRRIWGPGIGRIPGREGPARVPSDSDAAPGTPADDDGEHFIPPAPPPLPRLDPLAKGAWAGLFGGPGYLVVATAADWSVSGLAAFCAVAAFVAGFAILVLRMNDPDSKGPGGPDDGDDGAVV